MENVYLLGLDVGTTGCKAVVFDQKGWELGCGYREYPVLCEEPLQAEQNPEAVFGLLTETMQAAVKQAGVKNITAVSLSVQGDAVIPIDKSFHVLYPAVLGMDYRSRKQCERYRENFDEWQLYEETGQPLHPINMMSKIMWFLEERPEIAEKTWRFITYEEFIYQRLGGEPLLDLTMASRSMGYSLTKGEWSRWILKNMGISKELLSPITKSGDIVGRLSKKLALQIGLDNMPLLAAGGHDQPIGAVGAGVTGGQVALDTTGTAEVLSVTFPDPVLNKSMYESFYSCYFHAVPGQYFSFAHMQTGGILQQWYRDQFGYRELEEAKRMNLDYYTYAQSKCPDGPSPILVLPHFNGSGTPLCDMESKGAIVGLTLLNTRHEILKGILDGLCYELKYNIETMEKAGIPIRSLRAAGGGARSPLWLQTKADVTGLTVETLECKEAGCLGAAVLAAAGAGVYDTAEQAAEQMVRVGRSYEPRKEQADRYQEQYHRYRSLYRCLKPVFHA